MGYVVAEEWKMCRIMQQDDNNHEKIVGDGIEDTRGVKGTRVEIWKSGKFSIWRSSVGGA